MKATRCERCGRENDPTLAFCVDCGGPLLAAPPAVRATAALCARCRAPLQPGFRFCAGCGAPVPGAAPEERPTTTDRHRAVTPPPRTTAVPPPLPRRAERAFRLVAIRHDGRTGAAFAVRGEAVCGRSDGELRLPDDATVSPRHARFTSAGGALRVEDLGSLNGTFVRLRATSRRLAPGDELRIGRQLLRLEPVSAPAEGAARPWGGPDGGARLRLVQLLEGGGSGEAFPLAPGEHTIGREAGDVTFPSDRYVSARHARLDVDGGQVVVCDAGSSNGTFVRIAGPTELGPGDEVLIGGQLLRVDG